MIANIIIGLILAALFILAIRRALKRHGCGDCCHCGGSSCCENNKEEKDPAQKNPHT